MHKQNRDSQAEHRVTDFFSKYQTLTFRKGDTIIRPDNNPSGVLFIRSGYVRMYQLSENGKELTLNIFKPGTYFPMIWALSGIANSYYFESMTPTSVFCAPRDDVLGLLRSDPEILYDFTYRMTVGFYALLSNIERLLSANASQRVSSILSILARRFAGNVNHDGIAIGLSLSHEDVSRLAGLSRETTSIQMKKLMNRKLIYYKRRRIIVRNLDKLQSLTYLPDGEK